MSLPLRNKRIVVTRDKNQAKNFIKRIRDLGGIAVEFPVINIIETDKWEACDTAISDLGKYDWLIFTSVNSAYYFIDRVNKKKKRIHSKIAVIGKKTADFLVKNDIEIDLMPDKFNAESLLNSFKNISLTGKHVLLPVSNLSDDFLKNGLEKQGCFVDKIIVYHTLANNTLDGKQLRLEIKNGSISCLTFFSPSAFQYFVEILNNDIIHLLAAQNIPIAAIGDTTARAIIKNGLQVQIKPEQSSEESMLDEIINFF